MCSINLQYCKGTAMMPSPCLARWENQPLSFTDPIACLPPNGTDVVPMLAEARLNPTFYCSRGPSTSSPLHSAPKRSCVSLHFWRCSRRPEEAPDGSLSFCAFPGDERICVSLMRAVGLVAEERSCILIHQTFFLASLSLRLAANYGPYHTSVSA